VQKQIFPGWLPQQVARHYDFPLSELDGKGQTIAIISLGGKLNKTELRRDFKSLRIQMPKLKIVDIDAGDISDEQNNGPTIETHLDLEVIGSICPRADITIYRAANDGGPGFAHAVDKAVDDGNSVISISWGRSESPEDKSSEMEKALRKAKKMGVTVCVAAGDGGSSANRDGLHAIPAEDRRAHVEYPASSPLVLACGGTQLIMANDGQHEVVWNASALKSSATGGGVSEVFAAQTWQTQHDIDIRSANNNKAGRVIPDVAALAAGGDWAIMEANERIVGGGTSAVAPLWAALIVLANEKRASLGKPPLGFLNRRLYKLAANGGLFNDVTQGHNRPVPRYPGYRAGKGFDACTGWGTPLASKLLQALADLR
jgi:kumamolisin